MEGKTQTVTVINFEGKHSARNNKYCDDMKWYQIPQVCVELLMIIVVMMLLLLVLEMSTFTYELWVCLYNFPLLFNILGIDSNEKIPAVTWPIW